MPVSFRERRSARRRADAFSRRCDVDVSGGAAAESKRVAAREREALLRSVAQPRVAGGSRAVVQFRFLPFLLLRRPSSQWRYFVLISCPW